MMRLTIVIACYVDLAKVSNRLNYSIFCVPTSIKYEVILILFNRVAKFSISFGFRTSRFSTPLYALSKPRCKY